MTDKITITRRDNGFVLSVDGVLFWLGDHALWLGLVIAIGMILWVFGDSCDEQVERERDEGRSY